jgi:hypothetical protein
MRQGELSGTISDQSLRLLVDAIVADDSKLFLRMMDASPALALAGFRHGASRQASGAWFLRPIGHYINSGDTALHFAAASYRPAMVKQLIRAGALVGAKNRRGTEPLHLAAVGGPDSPSWNPQAQSATIVCLIEAGADANAKNKDGTTPLHRAIRTRCAEAVRTLLEHGADPTIRTKNGSTASQLAVHTTGRGGSGSPEAKAQQQQIQRLLESRR